MESARFRPRITPQILLILVISVSTACRRCMRLALALICQFHFERVQVSSVVTHLFSFLLGLISLRCPLRLLYCHLSTVFSYVSANTNSFGLLLFLEPYLLLPQRVRRLALRRFAFCACDACFFNHVCWSAFSAASICCFCALASTLDLLSCNSCICI